MVELKTVVTFDVKVPMLTGIVVEVAACADAPAASTRNGHQDERPPEGLHSLC